MTIGDISDRDLNIWLATHFGWKSIHLEPEAWADVSNQWHSGYMGSKDGVRTLIPDFVNDAEINLMLLKQLLHQEADISGCGETTLIMLDNNADRNIERPTEEIGRAVAESWALAKGWPQ